MAAQVRKPKIVVLVSGSGTNLQALIDNVHGTCADIALVVSNRVNAYGLTRARNARIPTITLTLKEFKEAGKTRTDFDLEVAKRIKLHLSEGADHDTPAADTTVAANSPDLIVLAGWMHILSPEFLSQFPPGRIINLHPALPGAFDGAHAIERAFQAFKEGKVQHTGVMVHKVIPEVDRGEVVTQVEVPIKEDDTLETLEDRIHSVEHKLIVEGTKIMLGTS
ncbi:formyl transferase [Gaertneriomyces semiglobifer]|nr:formyl transferase [Gaertneriomyces semiglobifer]